MIATLSIALIFMVVAALLLIRRGLGAGLGNAIKVRAAAVFERAEARGAFRKLAAFELDFLNEYPALRILEENYALVRQDCLSLLEKRLDLPGMDELSATYTSGGIHKIAWKTFMFKSGRFIAENCALAPNTASLLKKIPGVYTAFFSVLEPHQHIKPHWGYWKGFVRYHLGVLIPDDNRNKLCWIRINSDAQDRSRREDIVHGEKYYWRNGASVMFDDTFLHEAVNESDEVRVVLFLDVARKMPWRLAILNTLFLNIAHWDASVRQIRANARIGGKKTLPA